MYYVHFTYKIIDIIKYVILLSFWTKYLHWLSAQVPLFTLSKRGRGGRVYRPLNFSNNPFSDTDWLCRTDYDSWYFVTICWIWSYSLLLSLLICRHVTDHRISPGPRVMCNDWLCPPPPPSRQRNYHPHTAHCWHLGTPRALIGQHRPRPSCDWSLGSLVTPGPPRTRGHGKYGHTEVHPHLVPDTDTRDVCIIWPGH